MHAVPPDLAKVPRSADEAATRFAAIVFLSKQEIPTLRQLAEWSGLSERRALHALRAWHPELARLIAGEHH